MMPLRVAFVTVGPALVAGPRRADERRPYEKPQSAVR